MALPDNELGRPLVSLVAGCTGINGALDGLIGVSISNGRIQDLDPQIHRSGDRLIRPDLYLLPGFIDVHVHFDEPGRSHWEGISSGSRKAVLGGVTSVIDMPIDSEPPTVNEDEVSEKLRLFREKSYADYAVYAGAVPGRLHEMEKAYLAGAIGFKGFMCPSGWDSFPPLTEEDLYEAALRARALNAVLALHLEDPLLLDSSGSKLAPPIDAEVAAVRKAARVALETGAKLHGVHLSCPEAVQAAGALTTETCPHYFVEDRFLDTFGWSDANTSPPLRNDPQRSFLREMVDNKEIDVVASDHSPGPPGVDPHDWTGTCGVGQTVLALLNQFDRPCIIADYAARAARLFGLKEYGSIAPGKRANLITVERSPAGSWTIVDVVVGGMLVVTDGQLVGTGQPLRMNSSSDE